VLLVNHKCPAFHETHFDYSCDIGDEEDVDCIGKRYRCRQNLFPLHTVVGQIVSVDAGGNIKESPPRVDLYAVDDEYCDVVVEERHLKMVNIPDEANIFSKMCNETCPVYLFMKKNECRRYYMGIDENLKKYLTDEHVRAEHSVKSDVPKVQKWDLK
jgi:hypothetical protein